MRQTWDYEFQVEYNEVVVCVKLDEKLCDCGYWKLKGISCLHTISCLNYIRKANKELYTSEYFHTTTWRRCYSMVIHPILSQVLWPQFP